MRKYSVQNITDTLAISLSVLCFLHCLLAPVTLITFPFLGVIVLEGELLHRFIILILLPPSGLALFLGCRHHKDSCVLLLGLFGFFTLLLAAFFVSTEFGELAEKLLTSLGSMLMISGHIRNYKLCRDSGCDHHLSSET